jgi:hypothetical protein
VAFHLIHTAFVWSDSGLVVSSSLLPVASTLTLTGDNPYARSELQARCMRKAALLCCVVWKQ